MEHEGKPSCWEHVRVPHSASSEADHPPAGGQKWGNRTDFPTFAQLGEKGRRQEDIFDKLRAPRPGRLFCNLILCKKNENTAIFGRKRG